VVERRGAVAARQRRVRRLLIAALVLVYVPTTYYWRTRLTTGAVLEQIATNSLVTMDVFASRVPPAVRSTRLQATLAAALVSEPRQLAAAAERIRELTSEDETADSSVAVVVLDSTGASRWSSSPSPDSVVERVVARQAIAGGGTILLRQIGRRYLIDIAVASPAGRGELVAIRLPPRSLFHGPLHPGSVTDRSGRTSLFVIDGDALALVATESADPVPSLGPWPRKRLPRSFATAVDGRRFSGVDRDVWGREAVIAARPLPVPGMIIARHSSLAELRSLTRKSYWADSLIVSAGSALLVLTVLGVYRFARLRRAQDMAALRSDFVAGVSHELRTPLAQIRLFAQLLREGTVQTEEQVERSLRVIDSEARRLTFLVDNVLNFARIENDVRHPSPVPTDVARVVDEAIEAFGPLAETRSARVQAAVAPGLRVLADPRAVHQIILNFLDNALKYGPPGQTVRVSATATGTHVRLCVEDEGPGVPAGERSKVWRQFYRLVAGPLDPKASEVAGTGIGLAVVSELVAAYGGRVAIEDAPGGGARFIAELPAVPEHG
jgi:signal transduction histidine kinase